MISFLSFYNVVYLILNNFNLDSIFHCNYFLKHFQTVLLVKVATVAMLYVMHVKRGLFSYCNQLNNTVQQLFIVSRNG